MQVVFHSASFDKEMLMSEEEIKKMPKNTYIMRFMKAIDFRTAFSTLTEK